MVTVLIASFVLLVLGSYAIYCWQRPSPDKNADHVLPSTHFKGLFSDELATKDAPALIAEKINLSNEQRAALLARAANGDKTALHDAHASNESALYDEVLNALVESSAGSLKSLRAIVSYIVRSSSDDLRVNTKLCAAFRDAWRESPDKLSTAAMLHTAALSDDAAIYQRAIEEAHRCWRDQKLQNMTAEELRVLVESEYWVLSSAARSSGAGFMLKQSMAALRRRLSSTARATRTSMI